MSDRFAACLPLILKHEGGYVDDPRDNGGATNLGVTIGTLSDWLGRKATKADVKALTPATVAPIYRRLYWEAARCDALPAGLDYMQFDCAVNQGVGRASRFLQATVGAETDGRIGPLTLRLVRGTPVLVAINAYAARRERHYRALSDFAHFGRGWLRRLSEVKATARDMAGAP